MIVGLLLAGASASCKEQSGAAVGAAPPPSLLAKTRLDSPKLKDPNWTLATNVDAVDLAALADKEGATGLLEGVEDGGDLSRTALAALAFADDAELAYGRLGQIAVQLGPSETVYVLDAIAAIASQVHRQSEPLDREGVRTCAEAMREIAGRKRDTARVRATAVSILRMFADRHWLDPKAIPSDLDPPAR